MGRTLGLISVMIVVAIGGYIYINEAKTVTTVGKAPQTTIDLTPVRNDLLGIANAERRYWATNAKYASLDGLRENGDIAIPSRANYKYSAETTATGFKILASYSGPDASAPKHLSIDENMTIDIER